MSRATPLRSPNSPLIKSFKRAPLPFFIGLILAGHVYAGPEGGEIVGGAGTINHSGTTTTINQNTDLMAIDWQSFDVNSNERVQYIQPDSSSVSLNRIMSNSASHINGRVDANGHLIFVNPHGIMFGENSVINAGGILASGLSINPNDFMNGATTFSAVDGAEGFVINSGTLNAATGGSVTLLGKQVKNEGLISADLGSINFAAGREAVVTFGGDGFVGVRITEALLADDIGVDPAVINAGEINAEGGKVLLTASTSRDIFSQAVNNGDLDYGRSVVVYEDGSFTLGEGGDVSNSGLINVSGEQAGVVVVLGENITHSGEINADSSTAETVGHVEIHSRDTTLLTQASLVTASSEQGKGGDIKLLGERVGLVDQAQVSATGLSEGGQILIGGDYRGENELVRNASGVFVGAETLIQADAVGESGSGGKIILWGDDSLKAFGEISAAGIAHGGFVETSAGVVNLNLSVDVSAAEGTSGTWLIDPFNITIQGNGTTNVSEEKDDPLFDSIFTATVNDSILRTTTLASSLAGGANVLVETSGSGEQQGDITLSEALDFDAKLGSSLTLRAHDDIFINADIDDSNTLASGDSLNLTLVSNFDNGGRDNDGNLATGTGNIVIAAGVDIKTYGGLFTATGSNFTSTGAHINVASSTGGGDITIDVDGNATIGQITMGDTTNTATSNPASLFDVDARNIIFQGDGASGYDFTYGVDDSAANHTVNLVFDATGDITFTNLAVDNGGSGNDPLNVSLSANTTDGVITFNGTETLWLSGGSFTATGHDFILNASEIGSEGGIVTIGTVASSLTGSYSGSNGRIDTTKGGGASGNIYIRADEDVDLGYFRHSQYGSESTSTQNFELFASAGDDLRINQNIVFDRLVGTGTNTLTFNAGNVDPTDEYDNDSSAIDGIHVIGQLSGTTDQANITFGTVGTDSNLTDFVNTATINSNGGAVKLFVDGDVSVQENISTNGGDFTVGDSTGSLFANSFDNYVSGSGGSITTNGGVINISTVVDTTANGDVTLGGLDNSTTSDSVLAGNIIVTSGNDITLQSAYDFHNTGTGANTSNEDPSYITFTLNADNAITLNQSIYDSAATTSVSPGDNYGNQDTLNLVLNGGLQEGSTTGHVTIDADIYTAGGNVLVSGVDFYSAGNILRSGHANATQWGYTTTGGDISLDMTGDVTLGNIVTEGGYGGGDLNVTSNGLISDASGAGLTINGTTTLNADQNDDGTAANIVLNNSGNDFVGAVSITHAQDVTLNDTNGIVLGNSEIDGDLIVTATGITDSGAFTVAGLSGFTAGSGIIELDENHDFQNAVTVISASQLTLNDNVDGLALGDISITGSAANTITSVGAITQTTDNNIRVIGNNSASGNLLITGNSISLQNIDTSGANNQNGGGISLTATGGTLQTGTLTSNGGEAGNGNAGSDAAAITLNATGAITVGTIQAVGSNGNDDSDNGYAQYNGGAGANITINSTGGNAITLAGVSSDGGNGHAQDTDDADDASGGDAGAISVTTGTGQINIGGDITARGGRLWDNNTNSSNGSAKTITLSGNSVLTNNVIIDATLTPEFTDDGGNTSNTVENAIPATVTFDGTINGTAAGAQNLSVYGSNITFSQNVGETVRLGDLIIGEADTDTTDQLGPLAGIVDATNRTINAASVLVTASSFISSHVNTSGLTDTAGGDIVINVGTTLTTGDLTSTGGTATASGQHGGNITLNAADIIVSGINTSGSDAVTGSGGSAGAVNITALENSGTPSIILDGDVNTEGGTGDSVGVGTTAVLTLSGTGDTTGSITLNTTNFFTSNFTLSGNSALTATDILSGPTVAAFWESSANGAGTIKNAESSPTNTLSFSGFEQLQGGAAVDTFTLAHNFEQVSGGAGDDVFTVNAAIIGRLSGEDGVDTFTLKYGVTDNNTGTRDVDGGADKDIFNVAGGITATTIDGGDGTKDTLSLTDITDTHNWKLNSTSSGTLNTNIDFINTEQLNGSDGGDDAFEFGSFSGDYGGDDGGIDGRGSENDSLLVTTAGTYEIALGDSLRGMSNVETFEGGGAGFTLQLASNDSMANTTTTWEIDAANSGTVTSDNGTAQTDDDVSLTFVNFAGLEGNEANDSFEITTGSIVDVEGVRSDGTLGGAESNTLSFASGTNTWVLDGQHQGDVVGSHIASFSNIQTLSGAGSDTLTARDQANTWKLDTTNTLAATVNSPTDTVTFSGMAILNGNDQSDRFVVNASVAMLLSGGAGDDTFEFGSAGAITAGGSIEGGAEIATGGDRLIARTTANTWSLGSTVNRLAVTSGSTYVDKFSGIEILEGSNTAVDLFDFSSFTAYQMIAGASTGDIADYADVTGTVSVTVGSSAITGIDRFVGNQDGITSLEGNSSTLAYSSTTGASVGWTIVDIDADTNTANADGINDGTVAGIEFVNVNNLIGGDGNDTFTFDQTENAVTGLTGSLTGGGNSGSSGDQIIAPNTNIAWVIAPESGSESLTYNNGLNDGGDPPVNLQTTTAFSGFETLTSGSGNDSFTVGSARTVTLNAGTGADEITLPDTDLSITLGESVAGLTLNGFETVSATAGNENALMVSSGSGVQVDWKINSANSGTVTVGSGSATIFNNFQVLNGGDGNDIFDFSGGGSVVRTGSANGAVNGEGGSNTVIGQAVATRWTIDGNASGSLTTGGTAYVELFTGIQNLQGQSTVDEFVLTGDGSFNGDINGVSGADTLTVGSVTGERNEWRLLDSENVDQVRRLSTDDTASSSFTFSNIAALTGGTGTDEFIFLGVGTYGGTINASDNSSNNDIDIVDFSNLSGTLSVALSSSGINGVKNAERIKGNGANSTLTGLNSGTNSWLVSRNDNSGQAITGADGENDGVLVNASNSIQFINFANLTGGNNATDNFTLGTSGSVTGMMSGGTPTTGVITDSLTISSNNSQWTLSAANAGSVNGNLFTGIERVVANGSGDTLVGINQNNIWTITGINTGTVAEAEEANILVFGGIENLSGNVKNDEFVLLDNTVEADGQVTGTIRGTALGLVDGGVDKLTIESGGATAVTWQLNASSGITSASVAGRLNQASFIEQFIGGDGNDIFAVTDADVSATVNGKGSASDIVRLSYGNNAQWQVGGGSDTVGVSGRGSVTLLNIEIAEGSDTGQDSFSVNGTAGSLSELRGRGGNDTFTIATVDALRLTLDGGNGTIDELIGANRGNQWVFDNSTTVVDANTLNWDSSSSTGIDFSNIENFTGGTGADTFEVRSSNIVTALRGSAADATDTAADTLAVVRNNGATTTWSITGDDAGNVAGSYVPDFYDIENLLGSVANDVFTFTDIGASLAGLIDGAGGEDSLGLQAFTAGVVVELGPTATPGSLVDGTAGLPNVNVFHVETITAAHSNHDIGTSPENNNWLAIANDDVIDWNMAVGDVNEGIVRSLNSLADPTPIAGTETHFYHFGSLQGGTGGEQSNIVAGTNITGEYREGSGQRALNYSGVKGLVVVEISELIISLVGNDDTLLRVASGSEFNGTNTWDIDGENSGSFGAALDEENFSFDFSGVNQLQGGAGQDTFNFADHSTAATTGSLVNGFINGGGGANNVNVANSTGSLTFGFNTLQDSPTTVISAAYPQELTDDVYLANNRNGVVDLVNILQLSDTGDGTTTLLSSDVGTALWNIENSTGNTLTENSAQILFGGVDAVAGGDADDTFNVFQLGLVSNVFEGGGGDDTVNIESLSGALNISLDVSNSANVDIALSNIETLQALDAGHALTGDNVVNTWNITGVNDGELSYNSGAGAQTLAFTNMAHLKGGTSQDIFQLSGAGNITGTINGGGELANPDGVEVLNSSTGSFVFHVTTVDGDSRAVDTSAERIDLYDIEQLQAVNSQSHILMGAEETENTWQVAATGGTLSNSDRSLQFSGIDNLTGGNQQDSFTFNGAVVSGLVDGGSHVDGAEDTVTLKNLGSTGVNVVRLGTVVADNELNLSNIESVDANTPNALRLIGENNTNQWTIHGTDAGEVDGVTFSGFANIEGGTGNDTFVLGRQDGAEADDGITGVIDGGANPSEGTARDSLDLKGLQSSVTVALDPNYDADLHIANMETIEAVDNSNTLVGGNNASQTWIINSLDEGSVGSMTFSGFANLLGRNQVDIFNFTGAGDITGLVNGGGQPEGLRDRVDMSELNTANVVIGDTSSGFMDIEEFYGNNRSSVLTGANVRNEWSISGANVGTIDDENGNNIAFSGFTSLEGGSAVDIYTLNGGSISGEIRAGGGDDRLEMDLGSGVTGGVAFFGGADNDTVTVKGGDASTRFTTIYTPAATATASELFEYSITNGEVSHSYELAVSGTETINDRVYTSVFTLNNVVNRDDRIVMSNTGFEIEGIRALDLTNKNGFSIIGEQRDEVIIDGALSLNGLFSVTNASVNGADENAEISAAQGIAFISTGAVGVVNAPLAIETSTLSLSGVRDDVYLSQTGDLNIAALSNPASVVNIEATGSITSSSAFDSNNAVTLSSGGDILLDNSHSLSGLLTLHAENGDISLTNGTTQLGSVTAQNLALTTSGSVGASDVIEVDGRVTIKATDTSVVAFNNENNSLNNVSVTNAGTVILHDGSDDGVTVAGTTSDGFIVTASNHITANSIVSDDISLTSAESGVSVQNTLIAQNSVALVGTGVDISGAITVAASTADHAILVDAGSGEVDVRAALTANEALPGDIELRGYAVTQQLGAAITGRDINIISNSNAVLGADLSATHTLNVDASDTITMGNGVSQTRAEAQSLNFSAGTGIVTEQIVADSVSLTSVQGNIVQRGDVSVGHFSVVTNSGAFESEANTTTTLDGGEFTLRARSASLAGDIQSTNANLVVDVTESVLVGASIAVSDASVNAGSQFAMTAAASITSGSNITVNAGNEIQLARLAADQGTVSLTAGGAVTDSNGEQTNISANSLFARTETGFGGLADEQTIDTAIANLDLLNASGEVGLTNNQDVAVTALINNGDIRLVNTQGNVVMANASEGEYNRDPSITDAREAGGVINANYTDGNVVLEIDNGYLTATPGAFSRRPELVGDVIDVTTSDGFGVDRQLVVYAHTELIVSGPGIRPIWAFGEPPLFGLTTDSDLLDPSIVSSVSELLIEVDEIEYVDPAVFTNVRNYAYDSVSIRMPHDQLYDDEFDGEGGNDY
ncbi:filamentous hemagglutinin N-terminal domain-containing protein [Teredinibacter haidensis]|uniref:filamentous hemagglutinin N-terminal domain-containing protein n=1 Tax=Teredinibacter haidensis TaxID=2731755 RepID=UPI000948CD20|nr:filamentous hemagglutinin N-terminal domain-containing protein [Teredinibacter haidensis]